jgi:hypothetical protein
MNSNEIGGADFRSFPERGHQLSARQGDYWLRAPHRYFGHRHRIDCLARNVDRTYSSFVVLHKMKGLYWILILLLLSVGQIESAQAAASSPSGAAPPFPKPVEEYHDEQIPGVMAKLVQRIQAEPFNLVGTLIFLGAIIHTFLASRFMLIAHY